MGSSMKEPSFLAHGKDLDWRSTLAFDGQEPAFPPQLFLTLVEHTFEEKVKLSKDQGNEVDFILGHLSEEISKFINRDLATTETIETLLVNEFGRSEEASLHEKFILLKSLKKGHSEDHRRFQIRVKYCLRVIGAKNFEVCDWEKVFVLLGLSEEDKATLDWTGCSSFKDVLQKYLPEDSYSNDKITVDAVSKISEKSTNGVKRNGSFEESHVDENVENIKCSSVINPVPSLPDIKQEDIDEDAPLRQKATRLKLPPGMQITKIPKDEKIRSQRPQSCRVESKNNTSRSKLKLLPKKSDDGENGVAIDIVVKSNEKSELKPHRMSRRIVKKLDCLEEPADLLEEPDGQLHKKIGRPKSAAKTAALNAIAVGIKVELPEDAVKLEDIDFTKKIMFPMVALDQGRIVHVCAVCLTVLRSKEEFREHVKVEHKGKMLQCDACHYSADQKRLLAKHRFRMHGLLTEGFEDVFHCRFPGCAFKSVIQSITNEHYQKAHNNPNRVHNYVSKKKGAKAARKNVIYICEICGKSYDKYPSYECHMRFIHRNERKHVCDVCGEAYRMVYQLKQHKWREHRKDHPSPFEVVCDTCGEKFPFKAHLKYHVIRAHNDPEFRCPQCGKQFFFQCNLARHVRIHLKIKPFFCKECGKKFFACHHLTKHIGVNHMGLSPKNALKKEHAIGAKLHSAYGVDETMLKTPFETLLELLTKGVNLDHRRQPHEFESQRGEEERKY